MGNSSKQKPNNCLDIKAYKMCYFDITRCENGTNEFNLQSFIYCFHHFSTANCNCTPCHNWNFISFSLKMNVKKKIGEKINAVITHLFIVICNRYFFVLFAASFFYFGCAISISVCWTSAIYNLDIGDELMQYFFCSFCLFEMFITWEGQEVTTMRNKTMNAI